MTFVLIPTIVGDEHALAVECAIRARGHQALRFFPADLPTSQLASVRISMSAGFEWSVRGEHLAVSDRHVDVVWHRRVSKPKVPDDSLHPDDREFCESQFLYFHESSWLSLGRNSTWVNPRNGWQRASSKLLQLQLARDCGFTHPETLATNDPLEIRSFIRAAPHPGAICKPFSPFAWKTEAGLAIAETRKVTESDLPSDAVLRLCPGIFQHAVEKAYEIRLVVMGRKPMAIKIVHEAEDEAVVDWRHAMNNVRTEPYNVPQKVLDACFKMMDRLDIVFGAFDIIVTPQGEFVFLEVNEAGNFLFMELRHPEIRLLDTVAEFLCNPHPHFDHEASRVTSFVDVLAQHDFMAQLERDAAVHRASYPSWSSAVPASPRYTAAPIA